MSNEKKMHFVLTNVDFCKKKFYLQVRINFSPSPTANIITFKSTRETIPVFLFAKSKKKLLAKYKRLLKA